MNDTKPVSAGRRTSMLARTLVVAGLVLALVSVVAGYVRFQAFHTKTFEDTAAKLLEDEVIREEVASALVTELFASVDVQAELEAQLPEGQQGLAGPLTGALRQLGDRAAYELLGRPRVQRLFVAAAIQAQRTAKRALEDDLSAVDTQDGFLVLDLHDLVVELAAELSFLGPVADRLPAAAGIIRIIRADQFETAQEVTRLFRIVAFVIPWLALALVAEGVWLAPRRRRELMIASIGLVVVGVIALVARAVAGRIVVDQLAPEGSDGTVVRRSWSILTDLLADGAWTVIILALGALVVVWLLAGAGFGARARHALAPLLARRSTGYGLAAAVLLGLVWWQPTAQLGRLTVVVVFAVLLAIAVEVLRSTVLREEPGAAQAEPLSRLRPRLPARASSEVSMADELERLARLHDGGALDDGDYARAKSRILG
jgi:hypothetical protein